MGIECGPGRKLRQGGGARARLRPARRPHSDLACVVQERSTRSHQPRLDIQRSHLLHAHGDDDDWLWCARGTLWEGVGGSGASAARPIILRGLSRKEQSLPPPTCVAAMPSPLGVVSQLQPRFHRQAPLPLPRTWASSSSSFTAHSRSPSLASALASSALASTGSSVPWPRSCS